MTEKDKELQELRAENERLKSTNLSKRNRELLARVRELEDENSQMKRQIDGYIKEFRVCRFCTEVHSDCSPTDSKTCFPRWRGL